MKKNNLCHILFSVLLLVVATNGNATTVSYNVSNVGGNRWEYTYSITNNSLAIDIDTLTVYFGPGRYKNLVTTSTPAGWKTYVSQPDTGLPGDGSYSACSYFSEIGCFTLNGVALGDTLDGFSVEFDYLGTGTPGFQFFQIHEPLFNIPAAIVDEGNTIASPVPLPPALWLFISGIAMLVSQRKALLA